MAFPASLKRKIPMAMAALRIAPVWMETPVMASMPRPAPATLPMLNANPPATIRNARR
ncbi:hypothetical protein D3C86_2000700 [compost metagenome]